jgi:hypothetical protein
LAAKQAEETFNLRMAKFDSEYELTNEDRQVIASDIASLDEESFSKYVEKMKVLLSSKSVEFLKKQAEAASSEVVASVSVEQEATEVVVEEAIEKAEQENVVIANSTQTQEKTLKEKFAKAFTLEGFRIKI